MIAHIDADAFFASVLTRKDPRLKGKPLLALGMGGSCVIAASYEAKALGVKTGMPLTEALKYAPNAIRASSDFRETGIASDQIESIIRAHCPFIEQFSIDEWYLDLVSVVGGVPKNAEAWARDVQQTILRQTAFSVSIGVGPSKILAKMAGEYRKPAGVVAVQTDTEIEALLRDRPAAAIPGIGRKRSMHTHAHGWKTAWDFAQADTRMVKKLFGKPGIELQQELNGESIYPVTAESAPPKSVSRARSFRPTSDRRLLWAHVLRHLEYTVLKMRRHALACHGIGLWLRDDQYQHQGLQRRLPQPMDTEEQIRPYLEYCFHDLWNTRARYTQAGFVLWGLGLKGSIQFELFEDPEKLEGDAQVQKALDELHERYGRQSITRGSATLISSGTKPEMGYTIL